MEKIYQIHLYVAIKNVNTATVSCNQFFLKKASNEKQNSL